MPDGGVDGIAVRSEDPIERGGPLEAPPRPERLSSYTTKKCS